MRITMPAPRAAHLALLFLAASCGAVAPPPERPVGGDAPHTVLLTGFEPFGGSATNTSWEVARRLDGAAIRSCRVVAVQLPVVWEECSRALAEAVRSHNPRAVICTGVAPDRVIRLETTARNERRAYADNLGRRPSAVRVMAGTPDTIPSTLPLDAIAARLTGMGVGCRSSGDAGGYLCNEAFYTAMAVTGALGERRSGAIPAGFIHVPQIDPAARGQPGMTEDAILRAIEAAIDETLLSIEQGAPRR